MASVEIDIEVCRSDVSVPHHEGIIGDLLKGLLGVLPEAVDGGPFTGKGGGDLQAMVLEDDAQGDGGDDSVEEHIGVEQQEIKKVKGKLWVK